MFIVITFLVLFPFIALVLKGVFHCCDNCVSRFVLRAVKNVYWNSYIRFWMEAYLEMAVCSLLRMKNLNLNSPSASFHSVFSIAICVVLVSFFIFAIVFMVKNYEQLGTPECKQKYGALYLGLNTKKRSAVIVPIMFLLRRLLYASALIFWVDRSYFQI